MDVPDRLASLAAEDLARMVRRCLRDESAWPVSWSYASPGWTSLSPSTRALYRVWGTARLSSGADAPWTTVLKVVGDVDWPGFHHPDEPLYWRREALVLGSGLLDRTESPLVPVRILEQEQIGGDEVWLWQECLDGADPKPRWTVEQHVAAAYDLAGFNARWAVEPPVALEFPWLAQRWLRGWLAYSRFLGAELAAQVPDWWEHSLLQTALPPSTRNRFIALMAHSEELLGLLESLPLTLAHQDAQWRNLFQFDSDSARFGARTVAVDWGFAGLAPVGADLGHMVACNLEHWVVRPDELASHDQATTAAYLAGLRDFGWSGEVRAVLFARAASAALQMVPMLAAQVSWLHGEPAPLGAEELKDWPRELAAQQSVSLETAMDGWARIFTYLLDLGDEAQELAADLR